MANRSNVSYRILHVFDEVGGMRCAEWLTLRNGLPRFVVFIMWEDEAAAAASSWAAIAGERRRREN